MGYFYFCDANNCPLAQGTAIKFPSLVQHEAIIDYAWNGRREAKEQGQTARKPRVTGNSEAITATFHYVIAGIPSFPAQGLPDRPSMILC